MGSETSIYQYYYFYYYSLAIHYCYNIYFHYQYRYWTISWSSLCGDSDNLTFMFNTRTHHLSLNHTICLTYLHIFHNLLYRDNSWPDLIIYTTYSRRNALTFRATIFKAFQKPVHLSLQVCIILSLVCPSLISAWTAPPPLPSSATFLMFFASWDRSIGMVCSL